MGAQASKRDTRNRENGIARITISSIGPGLCPGSFQFFSAVYGGKHGIHLLLHIRSDLPCKQGKDQIP